MPEAPKFYWLMSTILGSLRLDFFGIVTPSSSGAKNSPGEFNSSPAGHCLIECPNLGRPT